MSALIITDSDKQITRDLKKYLRALVEAADGLQNVFAVMTQASDGTRTVAADFARLATEGGYQAGDYATANDAAKASFDEINAVIGNYNASVKAAADQALAIHGVT